MFHRSTLVSQEWLDCRAAIEDVLFVRAVDLLGEALNVPTGAGVHRGREDRAIVLNLLRLLG